MSKKLMALYSLKYNPFCQEVPTTALSVSPQIESFCWRIENQIGEGGFALVTGMPGSGKAWRCGYWPTGSGRYPM